jgi:hypothetical protein
MLANRVWLSPWTLGAHNWHAMSSNPNAGLVYIPGTKSVHFSVSFRAQLQTWSCQRGVDRTSQTWPAGRRGKPGQ